MTFLAAGLTVGIIGMESAAEGADGKGKPGDEKQGRQDDDDDERCIHSGGKGKASVLFRCSRPFTRRPDAFTGSPYASTAVHLRQQGKDFYIFADR